MGQGIVAHFDRSRRSLRPALARIRRRFGIAVARAGMLAVCA